MSSSQNLTDLRQKLNKWKAHNEVHAKASDAFLYEFLSDLLSLADCEEPSRPVLLQNEDSPLPNQPGAPIINPEEAVNVDGVTDIPQE